MIVFFNILIGLIVFVSSRKHLLGMLLALEMMALNLFLSFYLFGNMYFMYYGLVYLIFTVCEGAMGLVVLVMMSRSYGSDYFSIFGLG